MEKERLFLISKQIRPYADKTKKQVIILGYVASEMYPSRLANDHDYAKERYGYDHLTITEISTKCHIVFMSGGTEYV